MPVHRPSTPTEKATAGMQVAPWWSSNYSAQLSLKKDGVVQSLGKAVSFEVKAIREGVLKGVNYKTYDAYRKEPPQCKEKCKV